MKVMLATPSYSAYPHFNHSESVRLTLEGSRAHGIEWARAGALGCPVLPRVRNILVAQMLADQPDGRAPFDGILFVDDDIAFRPEDAARIVSHGLPVVAGVGQKRAQHMGSPPELNAVIDQNAPMDARTGVIRNRLVPSCFLWIHRSVFEQMLSCEELYRSGLVRRFLYHTLSDAAQRWCATYFGYGLAQPRPGGVEADLAERLQREYPGDPAFAEPLVDIGEDYDFAIKCEVAGIPLYIDSTIRLVHYDGRVAHDYSLAQAFEQGVAETRQAAE